MAQDTSTSAAVIAGEAYGWFEQRTRDSGETFTCLKDGRPEWVHELVRAAHRGLTDFLPDDYRYEWAQDALGAIHDADIENVHSLELDDLAAEFADDVDVYTHDLNRWYASNLNRASYCDEAVSAGLIEGDADITRRIAIGQYMEREEVFGLVVEALRDHIDTLDTDIP